MVVEAVIGSLFAQYVRSILLLLFSSFLLFFLSPSMVHNTHVGLFFGALLGLASCPFSFSRVSPLSDANNDRVASYQIKHIEVVLFSSLLAFAA